MHTHTKTTKPPAHRGLSTAAVPGRPRTKTVGEGTGKKSRSSTIGERVDRIEGSFRAISVHQLTLCWWLYQSRHITKRQYRLCFAAHELAEQRRYMRTDENTQRTPLYTMRQIAALVGGRGDQRAMRGLRGDIRALARLGLVTITKHRIAFAVSADQVRVDDLSGFWSMFHAMPNRRRSVPVPRRLLRAMAGGFSKGVTALMTAVLIRGLFWHRESRDYRTDGRYKLAWVCKHFGISRRAASDARSTLIELGWLEPLGVSQWEMNRWGLRDRIVPEWSHTSTRTQGDSQSGTQAQGMQDTPAAVGGSQGSQEGSRKEEIEPQRVSPAHQASNADPSSLFLPPNPGPSGATHSASPNAQSDTHSASPDLTDYLPLTGNLKTKPLRRTRSRSGVSPGSTWGKRQGSRKKSRGGKGTPERSAPPSIRDIQTWDLSDTARLLELHRQACAINLATTSEAGRLAFMALAQRARTRGTRPGAMLAWLLREQKHAFITLADEDEANRMLREHLHGKREQWNSGGGAATKKPAVPTELSAQERTVAACLRVAKAHRIDDPYTLARKTKGWSRQQWETALDQFNTNQYHRMNEGMSSEE